MFGEEIEITAEQAAEAWNTQPCPIRLIDVREAEELEIEKIQGAEWIPLSEWAERWESSLKDSGETLVFF